MTGKYTIRRQKEKKLNMEFLTRTKTKRIKVLVLFLTIHFSAFCGINKCHVMASDSNQYKLEYFLKDLSRAGLSNLNLYNKHMFINEPGKLGRSEENIKYYTDTLFTEIGILIQKNNYTTYTLAKAKIKYKKENLYDYYYEEQRNNIYVVVIKTKIGFRFYYALMHLGKIVSLKPTQTIDNAIIGWG